MKDELDFVTNRDLFSNYYLKEHLPETDDWEVEDEAELEDTFEEIRGIYEKEKDSVENHNESQLENNFIRPIFEALGHIYEVEETVERGQRRPDYALFKTDDVRRQAIDGKEEDKDFYRNALSVADAKQWDLSLDKLSASGEKKHDFSNPSHQIHVYLQETPVDWGVLTNGKHWRIYYSGTSHKLDSYYDVDLESILEDGTVDDFKYFYQFFRNDAFVEDTTGDCFLDDVYEGSNTYSQELGDDLQDNIYEAIKLLSEGFLKYPENDLDPDGELDLIHDASLTYLYRLIFVLYAESEGRNLLDTRNEIYNDSYSLNTLKREVVEELESGDPDYTNWQSNLWDRLDELFELIDKGSESRGIPKNDLYIPAYNGGLFKTEVDEDTEEQSRFLQENKVGDAYIAEVVELLTRSESGNGKGRVFVDYSSLDIRHLGSIYEGLLEYNLNVAEEPMVAVRDDGEEWMTRDEFEDSEYDEGDAVERLEEGDVYLTTDKGERKATGSYYTPEYVVQYIVENTLDPILDGIREDLVAESQVDKKGGDPNFADKFAERVFDLKILDPAMGSGHFLTNTVDHLAREIIDAQEKQADSTGIETVDESHDIHWARRQVAQKCIYGVDLNDMAVELAKVSLWLRTLAAEQPLAFLDHHLKTGNSLVGSELESIEALEDGNGGAQQATLGNYETARNQAIGDLMSLYSDIVAIENQELADIKEMEEKYGEFEANKLRQRLEAMLDVHTAEEFGVDVPDEAYGKMARALESDREWEEVETEDWFAEAHELAERESFFHWRLEYPEAFYDEGGDERENAGFDAVIGNPPYVRSITLKEANKRAWGYYKNNYESAKKREYDIYLCFVEMGTEVMNESGEFGYILPNKWFTSKVGAEMRRYLSENKYLSQVVDFGSYQVFEGATTYTCLLFLSKPANEEAQIHQLEDAEGTSTPIPGRGGSWLSGKVDTDGLSSDTWSFNISPAGQLFERLDELPKLGDSSNVFKGVGTNADPVYLLDKKRGGYYSDELDETVELEDDLLYPALKGNDIDPYHYDKEHRLLFPYRLTEDGYELLSQSELREDYPQTWDYLQEVRDTLEERESGKYEGRDDWYCYGRPQNMNRLGLEKAVLPDVVDESELAYDSEGRYILDTAYGIVSDDYDNRYLTTVLNTDLMTAFLNLTGTDLRGGYFRMKTAYLNPFPIPSISFDTPDSERSSRVSVLLDDYEDYLVGSTPAPHPDEDDVAHDFLAGLAERMTEYKEEHAALNLSLLDYLGISTDDDLNGDTLGDLYMPPSGLSDSTVAKTTEDLEGLRVEGVDFEDDGARLVMSVDISYKPDEDDPRETDTYGRLVEDEFESYEAMVFTGLSDAEETLIRNFVPVAVDEAGGFAGFRDSATKTNSLVDRIEALTLPDVDATRDGLERYMDVKERADELDEKIEKTDALIDEIVYDLYGLTDEEIEIVEEAVEDS